MCPIIIGKEKYAQLRGDPDRVIGFLAVDCVVSKCLSAKALLLHF